METIISKYNSLNVSSFKEKVEKLPLETLKKLKNEFDNRYFNTGEETIDDLRYDIFVEILEQKDKTATLSIGCKLRDLDNTTKLPYKLGGMDKIKHGEDVKLTQWIKNNKTDSYVISDKLNGVSCMAVYKSDGSVKLYTRGDGVEGADISYLAGNIKNMPKCCKKNIAVRGELVISVKKFEETYAKQYKNVLSVVVGTINGKSLKEPINDIDFVAYEVFDNGTPEENLKLLNIMNFNVVKYSVIENIDIGYLSSHLLLRKDDSIYDIDGVIVQKNVRYSRDDITRTGNPKYAFAFKMIIEVAEVVVKDVIWSTSKWGILKPRIEINSTKLTGITINYATGFNAAYIKNNKINVGSRIVITRSGDIIPYIVKVLTESSEPKMPDVDYIWNESKVDIMIVEKDKTFTVKSIVSFFTNLNIEHINEGVVSKLVDAGYTAIKSILNATVDDFLKIPTFKIKMSERIYTNIHTTLQKGVKISDLMCASSIFGIGIGKKKADMLCSAFPKIMSGDVSISEIEKIEGFSTKTAEKIVRNVGSFIAFCKDIEPFFKYYTEPLTSQLSNKFENKKYVFSGFRDKELEKYIIQNGGTVSTSVSSKTSYIVTIDETNMSEKIEKGRTLNIPILTKKKFMDENKICL